MPVSYTHLDVYKRQVTKTFELGYKFSNEDSMDSKYSVSVESMEHHEVEVRGSQDNIDKINSVKAVIDLKGKNNDFEQNAKKMCIRDRIH